MRIKVEIGIRTIKNKYRKMGFGIITVAATIKACLERGYKTIGWHCVEANKGSRAIASKLGFKHIGTYTAFSPYPPFENPTDLSEIEWNEWEVLVIHKEKKPFEHSFNGLVRYLHSIGMATGFNRNWAGTD